LAGIRRTAITRWTLALSSRKRLLDARRKQLRSSLGHNVRSRYFLISADKIEHFSEKIVLFIRDYLAKYHFKAVHTCTPLFALECAPSVFEDIHDRLEGKGVLSCDGYKLATFRPERFFRTPLSRGGDARRFDPEFHIRLYRFEGQFDILNLHKCDDLFIISTADCAGFAERDVNVERLEVTTFQELSYLLGLSDAYQ
jgi:hypothetical protein